MNSHLIGRLWCQVTVLLLLTSGGFFIVGSYGRFYEVFGFFLNASDENCSTHGPELMQSIEQYCENGLQFSHISDFLQFVTSYKLKLETDIEFFLKSEAMRRCLENKEIILELDRVMNDSLEDVCFPSHIDKILDYHNRFIKDYEEAVTITTDTNEDQSNIRQQPITRDLFKTYALQVAYRCTSEIQLNLVYDLFDRDITSRESALVTPWLDGTRGDGDGDHPESLDTIMGSPSSYTDLLIPKFADEQHNQKMTAASNQVQLAHRTAEAFYLMMDTCQQRMRPLYATIILPVISLAQAGYFYEDKRLQRRIRSDSETKRFYTIIQICELFRQIKLDPANGTAINDDEDSGMYIVSDNKEDSATLEERRSDWPRHRSNSMRDHPRFWIKMQPNFKEILSQSTKEMQQTFDYEITAGTNKILQLQIHNKKESMMGQQPLLSHQSQRARLMELLDEAMKTNDVDIKRNFLAAAIIYLNTS